MSAPGDTIVLTLPIAADRYADFEALCRKFDISAEEELAHMISAKVDHWKRYARTQNGSGTNPFRTQRNFDDRSGL